MPIRSVKTSRTPRKRPVIGFTGTQRGMTVHQLVEVRALVARLEPQEVHHGDCVGSDEEFHNIVRSCLPECRIVIHPPAVTGKQAFCDGDYTLPPKDYLLRNRDIVNACTVLVAAPKEKKEITRSGTWATGRYARRGTYRHAVIVVPPEQGGR